MTAARPAWPTRTAPSWSTSRRNPQIHDKTTNADTAEGRNARYNSAHLRAAAARRREQTLQRARDALRQLETDGGPITFDLVARAAGVSRAWLYIEPASVTRSNVSTSRTDPPRTAPSPLGSAPATPACCVGWKPLTPATANKPPRFAQLREQLARAHGQLRATRLTAPTTY